MKHFTLSASLIALLASGLNAQNFVRVDESSAQGKVLVNQDQVLEVRLHTNPSNGFSWQLANPNSILKQVGDWDFISDNPSQPIGAPGTQIIRFIGTATGVTQLSFTESRPWETGVAPAQTLNMNVENKGVYTGTYTAPVKPEVVVNNGTSTRALPTKYSWFDQGKMTVAKNQQSCGSCWTFAGCAVFESNILIKDQATKDLSEQWLLSCDKTGQGCAGGWCPFAMFQSKGAVYESDEPYRNANGTCKSSYTYHEKIDGWKEIAENPTTAQIKQAILDYGPVWVGVCAGNAMQSYKSGIIKTSDGSECNHAVVLCGWDDANSCWVMKNSWGSTWGENQGYCRIGYGVSSIGTKASYIIYKGGIATGVDNIVDADHIQVYPNPNKGAFSITGLGKDNHIEVIDLMGNVVFRANTKDSNINIDLSGNAKGIYIYKIFNSGENIKTGKIILN